MGLLARQRKHLDNRRTFLGADCCRRHFEGVFYHVHGGIVYHGCSMGKSARRDVGQVIPPDLRRMQVENLPFVSIHDSL